MNLADISAGMTIFVDANILLFALTNHPQYGAACEAFPVVARSPDRATRSTEGLLELRGRGTG